MERVKTGSVSAERLYEYVEKNTYESESKRGYECIKRIFDFVSSFALGIVLIIPCVIIAAIIFITDPGNPFYVQKRVGKDGKIIKMVKFRSMVKNADDLKNILTAEQYKQYKKEFKLDNDPRLLPHNIGKYIRKLSLDELPQILINICIKGDMSVVGPRPILQEELELNYTPEQRRILTSVKPGLTGYWQAYARNNAGYENGVRQNMELYYVENRGVWMDIKILCKTVVSVIKRTGAQ